MSFTGEAASRFPSRGPAPAPRLARCGPFTQVALVEQLVQEVWSGPCAVVLNPGWGDVIPKEYEAAVRSFEVAYSFLPISIKVRHTRDAGVSAGGGCGGGRGC